MQQHTQQRLAAIEANVATLRQEARAPRFKEMAKDFIGGAEAHLATMEHLAATVGEQSSLFIQYVETQHTVAAHINASTPFIVSASADSAEAQLEAIARELMSQDSRLTMERAVSQAATANPTLYYQYVTEQRSKAA